MFNIISRMSNTQKTLALGNKIEYLEIKRY